jgi:hypothetical protein
MREIMKILAVVGILIVECFAVQRAVAGQTGAAERIQKTLRDGPPKVPPPSGPFGIGRVRYDVFVYRVEHL